MSVHFDRTAIKHRVHSYDDKNGKPRFTRGGLLPSTPGFRRGRHGITVPIINEDTGWSPCPDQSLIVESK
jgi:hypothetical protein